MHEVFFLGLRLTCILWTRVANTSPEPGKFLGHGAHIPIFCKINGSKSFRSEEKLDIRSQKKKQKLLDKRMSKK
jgi:hypothetical protein